MFTHTQLNMNSSDKKTEIVVKLQNSRNLIHAIEIQTSKGTCIVPTTSAKSR